MENKQTNPNENQQPEGTSNDRPSSKSRTTVSLLSFFLGGLGVDRFYAGRTGLGIAKLLTGGGLGVWALIDFIIALMGNMKDGDGLKISNW
ncbi:TM2 domain-containing protein [Mycoplasma tullyi]|uniref:TM2 domain-containing protein n=1 Tax=Mycoplasma tullyi TaxID=1612150 RepID=A0A7D7U9E5_9MOLU|nr:TM2 domain-containing protein [Mycoplasma tullyi]QMT98783.1 TM2 domain-containing protein [Mycoplasma tullyi]